MDIDTARKARSLYEAGKTLREIRAFLASTTGTRPALGTVSKAIADAGGTLRPRGRRPKTTQQM